MPEKCEEKCDSTESNLKNLLLWWSTAGKNRCHCCVHFGFWSFWICTGALVCYWQLSTCFPMNIQWNSIKQQWNLQPATSISGVYVLPWLHHKLEETDGNVMLWASRAWAHLACRLPWRSSRMRCALRWNSSRAETRAARWPSWSTCGRKTEQSDVWEKWWFTIHHELSFHV